MELRPLTLNVSPERKIRAVLGVPISATMSAILVLAHGANNDMNNPLIAGVHEGLAKEGLVTVRFNFPYKEEGRSHPDPDSALEGVFRFVVDYVGEMEEFRGLEIFLGGKSMGARIAAQIVAQDVGANGLVFLGFPLHAPGKPEKLRDQALYQLPCPALFIQGGHDPFCYLDRLGQVLSQMPVSSTLHVLPGVGHSYEPPGEHMGPETMEEVNRVVLGWMDSL